MRDRKEELKQHGYRLVSEFQPPVNTPLLVITASYRCVGVLTSAGRWRRWGSEQLIEEVVAWRPSEILSRTGARNPSPKTT